MDSNLPNHDAKGWKGQTKKKPKKENKENQGQTALYKVKEKTTIGNITLYDAWTNALRIVQLYFKNQELT